MRAARVALGLAVTTLLTACTGTAGERAGGSGDATPATEPVAQARAAAQAFLDEYVDPDGRVVRRDQGGDTVSEGQSYALLLADVAGEEEVFDRVAAWTERLRRPDALLSFRAGPDGRVQDPEAASDGDLVVAWALARQGDVPEDLASAVLDAEVVRRGDRALLAAGPWATGEPATLNPSYWVLPAYARLAEETGDDAWRELAQDTRPAVLDVTDGGKLLPPDWARLDGTELTATPAPSGAVPDARYSLDAQRTIVWLAASCDASDQELAAGWWPLLEDAPAALALSLDGEVLEESRAPLPLVAAAAAAHAAGDRAARDRLLDDAQAQDAAVPTYYGSAWVALGRAFLQTDLLEEC